jgi:hypothetical protein
VILRGFDFPADWWARVVNRLWRVAVAGGALATEIVLLREVHPLLAAVTGAPVYLTIVLTVGVIAKDDWDLIYRLAIAMPGGAVVGRYWKRKLA